MSMRHCASISDSPCLRHVEDPSTPGTGWIGAIRAPPRAPPAPPPRRRGGGAHCSLRVKVALFFLRICLGEDVEGGLVEVLLDVKGVLLIPSGFVKLFAPYCRRRAAEEAEHTAH